MDKFLVGIFFYILVNISLHGFNFLHRLGLLLHLRCSLANRLHSLSNVFSKGKEVGDYQLAAPADSP